jgi:hypothetical protein
MKFYILFTHPRLRALFGLPTVRVYHEIATATCDEALKQPVAERHNAYAQAIRTARLAYVLAVRQGAGARPVGVLLRSYLTICLRAHRPDLVSLGAVPLMHRISMAGFDQQERRDIATLLNEGTEWYHRGIRPYWLGKPAPAL